MRKKTNFAGLVITGTATAFVGLAVNAQAIPISIHDDADAWGRSERMGHDHDVDDAAGRIEPFVSDHLGEKTHSKTQSIDLSNLNKKPTSPTVLLLSSLGTAQNSSSHRNFPSGNLPHHNPGVPPPTSWPIASGPALTTVPDGGNTTLMIGGAFCGLVLLRKKLEA
jgi:hypothetical protein